MYYALPASLLINLILVLLLVVMYLKARKLKQTGGSVKPESLGGKSDSQQQLSSGNSLAQARELLAQNKVAQAVGFCEIQLDQDPADHDLRLFLMAIYVKTRQAEAFENQYDIICHQADAETVSKANALRSRFEVSPNDIPKSKIDAIQSERSAIKTPLVSAESETNDIPTLDQTDSGNLKALEEPQTTSDDPDQLDNLDIDFDLEPSLDQTLLELENEMTQTAMTSVSLTNLKITIDEDISDSDPEADLVSGEPDLSLENFSASSTDETSETSSIDFEPSNAIEFESKEQKDSTDSLSLDDISYELDIKDETDQHSLADDQAQKVSDQPSELALDPVDDDISLEESGEIEFVVGEDHDSVPTLDQPADTPDIPTLDKPEQSSPAAVDLETDSSELDSEYLLELESELAETPDTTDPLASQPATEVELDDSDDDLAYQLDMDDDSLEVSGDGDTFDFGEALAGNALDQIELDSAESEPGTFDLSMQFEAVDQPKNKPETEDKLVSDLESELETELEPASEPELEPEPFDLDDELNFGFSLEPEVNSSTDTKTDFSVSVDEDESDKASELSAEPTEDLDTLSLDSSDFLDIAEDPEAHDLETEDQQIDIQSAEELESDLTVMDEAMPNAEFDFDFEEADSEEAPTLISPALSEAESSATSKIDSAGSEDIDDDWFASLDREFSDIDSGESTHVNLKLAKEYIRLGETSGAQILLEEVIKNGADDDRKHAQKLLDSM